MSGVMLHVGFDKQWMLAAIPQARITVVRLRAGEESLIERLDRRETGAGRDAQIERSLRQARRLADEATGDFIVVETDGRSPAELAGEVLGKAGWLPLRPFDHRGPALQRAPLSLPLRSAPLRSE